MTWLERVAAAITRLVQGYWNSGDKSPSNPGGLDNDGHVEGLPALLEDVGVVAQQVGIDAAVVAADKAAVANDKIDVAYMVAAAATANDAAAGELAATLAAAETAMGASVAAAAGHADNAAGSAAAAAASAAGVSLPAMTVGDAGKSLVWGGAAWSKGGPYAAASDLAGKAAINLTNVPNADFAAKANAAGVGGGFVNPMATAGDLIVGGAGGAPQRLGLGSNGSVLSSVGGALVWAVPAVPFGWSATDKHSSITLSDENRIATGATANKGVRAVKSILASTAVYFEVHIVSIASSNGLMIGLMQSGHYLEMTGTQGSYFGEGGGPGWGVRTDGFTHGPSGAGPSVSAAAAGAVTMHAVSNGKYWYGVNGVWQASGNPAAGANPLFTASGVLFPGLFIISSGSASIRTVSTQWQYSPPAGFGALP